MFVPRPIAFVALTFACVTIQSAEPGAPKLPPGYALIYQQDFDQATSIEQFQFSDPKAWRWSEKGKASGALELFKQSDYKTTHRSPFNIAMLSDYRVGDFVMEFDAIQTGKEYGHRDMCLYFGFQGPEQFYYVHLATSPDANAHNAFLVNHAPRKSFLPIQAKGIDWGNDWKHLRLEREGKQFRVYFENMTEPVFAGEHDAFLSGFVGVGSFDDTGKIDNFRLWAPKSEKESKRLFEKP